MSALEPADPCPYCTHPLVVHSLDHGCHANWPEETSGDGCHCPLSLSGSDGGHDEAGAWAAEEARIATSEQDRG